MHTQITFRQYMACPLERPNCKRDIMASSKLYVKKECPLNVKEKCALSPAICPLLPQKEDKCGYAKLMGQGEGVDVTECPRQSCFCVKGCPISLNPCLSAPPDTVQSNIANKWPDKIPPCLICTDGRNESANQQITTEQISKHKPETIKKVPNIASVPKCSLTSSPRPLPCAECILKELSNDCGEGRKDKTCPYLALPEMCSDKCHCPEVPNIDIGPLCAFAPLPCPCCATPRCPLSRQADCILQTKPQCCLTSPKCLCGSCSLSKPCSCSLSCSCGVCSACISTRKPSCCPLNPCPESPVCGGGCCSITYASNCCLPSPCCSLSPPPLCSATDKPCPLLRSDCSSPSCIPCLLKTVQCILSPCCFPFKSICPPIPPSCSLKNDLNPSDTGSEDKKTDERTFHLPTCSLYEPPCGIHSKLDDKKAVCPFMPNQCPIGLECPFPVSIPSKEKITAGAIRSNKKNDSSHLTKCVRYSENENEIRKFKQIESKSVDEGNINSNPQCPYSRGCGVVPLPECPAAEILCPEIYKKPQKEKRKPCPYKKCIKKQGCPLNVLQPQKVDCPLGNTSNCPLTIEPECPFEELANRCPLYPKCSCCPSPNCCTGTSCFSVNLPCGCPAPKCTGSPDSIITLTCDCPNTCTDGFSPSLKTLWPNKIKYQTPNYLNSNSTLNSYSSYSSLLSSNNSCTISKSISTKNNFSTEFLNKTESPKFDGYCSQSCFNNDGTSESISFEHSNSECPFEPLAPKTICPLAPPKCPLTPKPTTCPLTRKPEPCALSKGGELVCPVQYPPCKKFPGGRCPMGDINVCDCEYPVSPCLLPLQASNVIATPQYCFREDCCMGLPFPPTVLKTADGQTEEGPYYQFKDSKPGKEETKHYVDVLKDPPDVEIAIFGKPKKRLHDNWTIVKCGEGYLRCKTIAKKLQDAEPYEHVETQYDAEDCPIDEETRLILENRKKHLRDEIALKNLKVTLGFTQKDIEKKKKKSEK